MALSAAPVAVSTATDADAATTIRPISSIKLVYPMVEAATHASVVRAQPDPR
jgi:hypothetical protein